MKKILWTVVRHAIGAVGAVLAWAATTDMQAITDIATDMQAIVGALMTISAAGGGIYNKIMQKRALKQTALYNAVEATNTFDASVVGANGEFKEYALSAKEVTKA